MTQIPAARLEDELTDPDMVETDAGPARAGRKSSADPVRRCIATMRRGPPAGMIRFVLAPDGVVTPDLAARLPGRGAWVSADRASLDLAIRKGAFSRAFKTQARVAEDLSDVVEALLARRALDQLGLGRRAGDVVAGFDQVRDRLRSERPACLLEASDGSADGRGKVLGLARAAHPTEESGKSAVPVAGCFSADELGMALGRGRVIHACVKQGRFASTWMDELARLSGFRRLLPEEWAPEHWASPDPTPAEVQAASTPRKGET